MKVIMIDAFKPEYLKYAPYLNSLTKKYQHGRLKVPTGYWGGMETFFKGKSDTIAFWYYNENSPFRWTKYFTFLGKNILTILINLQKLLKNEKQFFRIYNIPLRKLKYLDVAVKKPLYENAKFEYKEIHELDKISHKYGTKARETIDCVKKIDDKIKKENFDLVFSDHGMIDIKETINVPRTKICFIDSTMARYWDKKPKIKENGRWIKGNEKFGKYIFLANLGILIFPNYWNKNVDKGMHGYNSSNKEMDGFYLIKKDGKRKDVTMKELNIICKKFVNY